MTKEEIKCDGLEGCVKDFMSILGACIFDQLPIKYECKQRCPDCPITKLYRNTHNAQRDYYFMGKGI